MHIIIKLELCRNSSNPQVWIKISLLFVSALRFDRMLVKNSLNRVATYQITFNVLQFYSLSFFAHWYACHQSRARPQENNGNSAIARAVSDPTTISRPARPSYIIKFRGLTSRRNSYYSPHCNMCDATECILIIKQQWNYYNLNYTHFYTILFNMSILVILFLNPNAVSR